MMAADPRMSDWPATAPVDETYFAERARRMRPLNDEEQAEIRWDHENPEPGSAATVRPLESAHLAEAWAHTPDDRLAVLAAGADLAVANRAKAERLRRAQTQLDGIEVLTWPQIMAEPSVPPPTIRPGVPEVGVTVVAGSPKVGKTLWVSQVALESGRSTLMVIEEGSLVGISYRLRLQAAAMGIENPPIHLALRKRIRLDDPKSVARLYAWVDAANVDLVIFDPLNRLHSADENRPSDMTRVMDGMAEIAYRLELAVLAVHHLSKPSAERRGDIWDRFRGASSIRSGTDANLVMDGTGDRIHLVGEFRDAEPLSEWMELDRQSLIFRPSEAPDIPAKVDQIALRAFVEERGQVTARQIVERFEVTKPTAFRALRALGCDEFEGVRGVLTFTLGTGK